MRRAALALALCGCAVAPPAAPPPPDPCPASSNPTAVLGFGPEGTTPLAQDAEAEQIQGSQGLSHLFVGARTTGLNAVVDVTFEARDAFTGGLLGTVRRPTATLAPFADTPTGSCEVRRVLLALNGPFPGGAGLATVRVTARDAAGRSAADARRVWIGRALPTCVPGEGAAPSIVPLSLRHPTQRREEALALRDDDALVAVSGGDALVGVATRGFAASAVTLTVALAEEGAAGRRTLREYRAAPVTGEVTVVPVPRRVGGECVSPATVRVPVETALAGRALVLVLRADDGLGHALTVERAVTLSAM